MLENEYKSRINKALDYIESNIEKQFSLEELSGAANFSKFHFNRIFYAIIGETPFQFILRVRLEKAATLLISNPMEPISEIAQKCGFSDLSIFSRNFKRFFGLSATSYRKAKPKNSNNSQIESNNRQAHFKSSGYFCNESKTMKWRTNMELNKSIEVKELQKMTVAYVRHIGPYKGNDKLFEKLWNKLFAWAGPRGLLGGGDMKMLVMYHDDPNVTDEEKLRMSVCLGIPENTKVDGEIGKMPIDGGKYAIGRFVVDATQFQQAWEWMYGEWLPASGYQPDDKPCFEMYPEEPKNGQFTVDICIPVKLM